MKPSSTTEATLSFSQALSYALPVLAISFLFGPIAILKGVYAKYFGMSLMTVAAVLLIARIFDAVTDPLVGYCSDRYYAQSHSRKPFVIVGGTVFIVGSCFLYIPPEDVSTAYFLGWFLVFYLGWTIMEIPHLAWGGELTANSTARTKVYTLRVLFSMVGQLLFFAVPLLPFFATNEFTPQTLKWSALITAPLLLLSICICVRNTPDGNNVYTTNQENVNIKGSQNSDRKKENIRMIIKIIFGNKPFLLFLGAFLFAGAGVGMFFSLLFIYVDTFLRLGDKISLLYSICLVASTVTVAVWYKLSLYVGKIYTWGIGMLLVVIGLILMNQLAPGESNIIVVLSAMLLVYFGVVAMGMLAPSLLADIIDYGIWKFGKDYAATYFSVYTLLTKINGAVGGALGLAVAGWYGFDASSATHTEENIFGIRLAIAWMPAVFTLLSLFFIALAPINGRRHAIIRKRLEARGSRSGITSAMQTV